MIPVETKFCREQLHQFATISKDWNPLHTDVTYTAKSNFEEQVVYGVLLIFWVIGEAICQSTENKHARLISLSAVFKSAVMVGERVHFKCSKSGQKYECEIFGNGISKTDLTFQFAENPQEITKYADINEIIVASYLSSEKSQLEHAYSLEVDACAFDEFRHCYNVHNLSIDQSLFLLWTSYFVGMKEPGEQALFTNLQVKFPENQVREIEISAIKKDARFQRTSITGRMAGGNFELIAISRNQPVTYDRIGLKAQVEKLLKDNKLQISQLQNAKCFVTGGSRGIGSIIVDVISLSGIHVDFSYHKRERDAKNLAQSLPQKETKIVQMDFDTVSQHTSLPQVNTDYDFVVLNAMSTIKQKQYHSYSADEWHEEVGAHISMMHRQVKFALSALKPNGALIFISSHFVRDNVPGFSSYSSAKIALENLLCTLANEQNDLDFFVFRFPRLLTDQTNKPILSKTLHTPERFVIKMVATMLSSKRDSSSNLVVIDL